MVGSSQRVTIGDVRYDVKVYLLGARDPVRLQLRVVDQELDDMGNEISSDTIDLTKASVEPYKRDDPSLAGTLVTAHLSLPANFNPGVLVLTKLPERSSKNEAALHVAHVELQAGHTALSYPAYTHIDVSQGERWLFPGTPALPAFADATPSGLQLFREKELAALRGTTADAQQERTGAERIYDYQVYNDLGNPAKPLTVRPVLGGGVKDANHYPAYPRRLRTGRPLINGIYETPLKGSATPWLPQDEDFDPVKLQAFDSDTGNAVGMTVRSVASLALLRLIPPMRPIIEEMFNKANPDNFPSLGVVDTLFRGVSPGDQEQKSTLRSLLPIRPLHEFELLLVLRKHWRAFTLFRVSWAFLRFMGGKLLSIFRRGSPQTAAPAQPQVINSDLNAAGAGHPRLEELREVARSLLDKWPAPGVRQDRSLQWRTDEEFGRQALSGQNPLSIRAVTTEDLQAFAVRDSHVVGLLGGRSLAQAVAEERLWVLDFVPGYVDVLSQAAEAAKARGSKAVLHAGRCVFFSRDDGETVPVSIELQTAGTAMRVFTPKDHKEVWELAKAIISSLDSGIHQLISHFLTTHACVEPYIIATRRELSILNPARFHNPRVYKLLQPHFRYTMRINCNARSSLVNADGILEQVFTPGSVSLQLSALVYEGWRFADQALPADLLKRGVAEQQKDGSLRVKVPHYRYAEDGLLLWKAIHDFVGSYLALYYDDRTPGKKVTDDAEVVAWWRAVQNEGHPDIKEGWPTVTDIASLRDVLAAIIWTTSCHHAAVNFGQYDNSAYFPNKPSLITGTIPAAGSQEEKDLLNRYDENMLQTITPPIQAVVVMLTVRILSSHAPDEEFLDEKDHRYIKDAKAVKVHAAFVAALQAAEKQMEARNQEAATRAPSARPYSLLMPSKPPPTPANGGPPPRGVPYSISI